MAAYYAVMTELGRIKLAAAAANNQTLDITHMVLGDGAGGAVGKPTGYETTVVNEIYRNTLNSLTHAGAQFTADMVIAPDVGGWTVREMGLLDSDGDLVAYANTPAIEKAQLSDGAPIDFVPTITVEVESPDSVTVIVNPAIITASRLWVGENFLSKANNLADIQDKAAARVNLGAGVANGLATLDENGLVPEAQMPIQRLSEVFTVEDEAAMLALTAVKGDVCVRADENKTYILSTAPATDLANWVELQSNTVVISVAGKTGTVELEKADVGLANVDNTSDEEKPISALQGQAITLAAQIAAQNLAHHAAEKEAHGATPANTKNTIIRRDANGRAKVSAPAALEDIANKQYVDQQSSNMRIEKDVLSIGDISSKSGTSYLFTNTANILKSFSGGRDGTRIDIIAANTGSIKITSPAIDAGKNFIPPGTAATFFKYDNKWYTIGAEVE